MLRRGDDFADTQRAKERQIMSIGRGVKLRDVETCWRCLREDVPPGDDHIGLCGTCLQVLREPLASTKSESADGSRRRGSS